MKTLISVLISLILVLSFGTALAEDEGAVIEYDLDAIAANITEAYGGISDQEEYIGFGVNEDGSFAIMFFFNEEEHVSFVGPAVVEDELVTISDEVNGMAIAFEVIEATEDGVVLDLGDVGTAVLAPIEIEDLIDGLAEVIENTQTVESIATDEAA